MSIPITPGLTAGIFVDAANKARLGAARWPHPGGQPLVQWVARRLQPQVERVLVHAAVAPAICLPADLEPVGRDPEPLAAVIELLRACDSEFLLLVPVDTPQLPLDLAARLAAALSLQDDCAVADEGHRVRPLFALLRRRCLPLLEAYQLSGGRGGYRWLQLCRGRRVDFSDRHPGFVRCAPDRGMLPRQPRQRLATRLQAI